VRNLPEVVRKALFNRVVDRAGSDLVAERLLGTMSDTEVVEALADVAEKAEKDPVKLAEQLNDRGVRRADLKGLAVAMLGRPAISGENEEPTRLTKEEREGRERVAGVVSRLLSSKLKTMENQDQDELKKEFPTTDEQFRVTALATLRDYIAVEEDIERFEKVLDLWAQEVRLALRAAVPDTVHELVGVMREGNSAREDEEWKALVASYGRRVVDGQLVETLRTTAQADGMAAARTLLDPLGDEAVEGLLDLLAEERDKVRRVFIISLLTDMAGDYRDRVIEWFDDPRWFVARNSVTILIRSGVSHDIRPLLERAAAHEHPAVRREGVQGLTALLGAGYVSGLTRMASDPDQGVRELAVSTLGGLVDPSAVPALGTIARNNSDESIRRRAIEALGHQGLPGSRELLTALASFWNKPRLHGSLRRIAKKLAKDLAKGRRG
jgi:HEAT repeat protein